MYNFQDLLKQIRKESDLTQEELARVLDVSTILISMLETGQKDVSKNFIEKLAKKLNVHPSSIAPFVFTGDKKTKLSGIEKQMILISEKLQTYLIKIKAKNLKQYA